MKPFSDEQLRAYFLGKLPEREARILEEESALSAELTEQSQMIESELADDYLRGNLSAADVSLFEANYLITEVRRHKLRVSESLWKIAGERKEPKTSAAPAVPKTSFWQTVFSARGAFRFAFAGAAVLLIFGAAGFYLLSLSVDRSDVAEVKEINQPAQVEPPPIQDPGDEPLQISGDGSRDLNSVSTAPNVEPREANKDFSSPPSLPQLKPIGTPKAVRPSGATFAAFLLSAGTLRGGDDEQSITIAPHVKNLNLLLNPAGDPQNYHAYRTILKTADGDTVYTSPKSRSLNLPIAAEKLENRTYIIFLEGQNPAGEFESIAEYTFRVRR